MNRRPPWTTTGGLRAANHGEDLGQLQSTVLLMEGSAELAGRYERLKAKC
jgi:hypothetical protein